VAKQKIACVCVSNFSFFFFSIFWISMILLGNIHTSQNKKMYAGAIYGSFSFLLAIKPKKLIKNIFVKSGYFKLNKSLSIFPLLLFVKTFVVRGGSI